MAKMSNSMSFKNMYFKVVENDEGKQDIWLIELTKDDEIYTNFQEVLDHFDGEEGISLTIKVEKGLNE